MPNEQERSSNRKTPALAADPSSRDVTESERSVVMQNYPTYRFPKWLYAETYTITHDAGEPGRFAITIERGKERLVGFGATITQAARRASQNPRRAKS